MILKVAALGTRPSFLTLLSLADFRPLILSDDHWLEGQLDAGRSFFGEIPDEQLPFTEVADDLDELPDE